MLWDLTLLIVNVAALVCAIGLFRRAPCAIQKTAIGLVVVAMLIHSAALMFMLYGVEGAWRVRRVAGILEHLGVLLIVFRLSYKEWLLNARSHNSRISDRALN